MGEKRKYEKRKIVFRILLMAIIGLYLLQTVWSHRIWYYHSQEIPVPIEAVLKKDVMSQEDYALLFEQTGLGRCAIDELLGRGEEGKQQILNSQRWFFKEYQVKCTPLLWWFTREDILIDSAHNQAIGPPIPTLQPGDILLTLSTHSLGWTHGHAAIALDHQVLLESRVLGENSALSEVDSWRYYANYVIVRVKNAPNKLRHKVAEYARESLQNIPYRLTAGLLGEKAADASSAFFGSQCAYLPWYAWNQFGIDLDGDGGRLVTPMDILKSDKIEIVQVYGIDPALF